MIGDVIHEPLKRELRKGLTVRDQIGVDGVIVGFKSFTSWFGRRSNRASWVIVETADGLRSYRAAADLRVVERKAVARVA